MLPERNQLAVPHLPQQGLPGLVTVENEINLPCHLWNSRTVTIYKPHLIRFLGKPGFKLVQFFQIDDVDDRPP